VKLRMPVGMGVAVGMRGAGAAIAAALMTACFVARTGRARAWLAS
jgi:hypothetical protein